MGAVAIDLFKSEREFSPLTLSDDNVVKYLLLYRSKIDISYGANTNINFNQAGDMYEFNQEIIALYASLDVLIGKIEIKNKDREFLNLVLNGYSITDIIEEYDFAQKTAYRTLKRIIMKIVEANNQDWVKMINENDLKLHN
ncbi:hypothetical protein Q7A53_06020 [Halobacillus rhizosphaerae]|uniref:hypothetical protein n=1 Tax=Halobacillus rhizosphaerae TaxID=3064889 RepID=UPI00398B9639